MKLEQWQCRAFVEDRVRGFFAESCWFQRWRPLAFFRAFSFLIFCVCIAAYCVGAQTPPYENSEQHWRKLAPSGDSADAASYVPVTGVTIVNLTPDAAHPSDSLQRPERAPTALRRDVPQDNEQLHALRQSLSLISPRPQTGRSSASLGALVTVPTETPANRVSQLPSSSSSSAPLPQGVNDAASRWGNPTTGHGHQRPLHGVIVVPQGIRSETPRSVGPVTLPGSAVAALGSTSTGAIQQGVFPGSLPSFSAPHGPALAAAATAAAAVQEDATKPAEIEPPTIPLVSSDSADVSGPTVASPILPSPSPQDATLSPYAGLDPRGTVDLLGRYHPPGTYQGRGMTTTPFPVGGSDMFQGVAVSTPVIPGITLASQDSPFQLLQRSDIQTAPPTSSRSGQLQTGRNAPSASSVPVHDVPRLTNTPPSSSGPLVLQPAANPQTACAALVALHYDPAHVCCTTRDGVWSDSTLWTCGRRPETQDVVGVFHKVQLFTQARRVDTVRVYALWILSTQLTQASLSNGVPLEPLCSLHTDVSDRPPTGARYKYPWTVVNTTLAEIFVDFRPVTTISRLCKAFSQGGSLVFAEGQFVVGPPQASGLGRRLQDWDNALLLRNQTALHSSSSSLHDVRRQLQLPPALQAHHQGPPGLFVGPKAALLFFEGVAVSLMAPSIFENRGTVFLGPVAPMVSCAGITGAQIPLNCGEASLRVQHGASLLANRPVHVLRLETRVSEADWKGWIGYPSALPAASISSLSFRKGGVVTIRHNPPGLRFAFKRLEIPPEPWPPSPQSPAGVTLAMSTQRDPQYPKTLLLAADFLSAGRHGSGNASLSLPDGHLKLDRYADASLSILGRSRITLAAETITVDAEFTDAVMYDTAPDVHRAHSEVSGLKSNTLHLMCRKVCYAANRLYFPVAGDRVAEVWRFSHH